MMQPRSVVYTVLVSMLVFISRHELGRLKLDTVSHVARTLRGINRVAE